MPNIYQQDKELFFFLHPATTYNVEECDSDDEADPLTNCGGWCDVWLAAHTLQLSETTAHMAYIQVSGDRTFYASSAIKASNVTQIIHLSKHNLFSVSNQQYGVSFTDSQHVIVALQGVYYI